MTPSRSSSHVGLVSPGVRSPSLPTPNGDGVAVLDNVIRTKVLLLGLRRYVHERSSERANLHLHILRRVGKTSIQEVIFNNLPPKQTFYLETTTRVTKSSYECVLATLVTCHSSLTQYLPAQSSLWKFGIVKVQSPLKTLKRLSANSQL